MTFKELKDLLTQADEHNKSGNYVEAEVLANKALAELDNDQAQPHLNPPPKGGLPNSDSDSNSFPTGEGRDGGLEEGRDGILLRANALLSLATTAWRRGNYSTALEYARQTLALVEEHSLAEVKPKCLNLFGNVYYSLSDYPLALEYYAKALSAHEELGNKTEAALVTGNIGLVYGNLSDYPRALEYLVKALASHEELGDKAGAAGVTGNIGNVYNSLSDYPRALEYMVKALATHEELGNKAGAARVTGNIGNVYVNLSDYPRALEYLIKALAAHEEVGNKAHAAIITGNIGTVYLNLGSYDKALEYYHNALATHEELGDKSGVAGLTMGIGSVYASLGSYDKALEYYHKALATQEKLGGKSSATLLTVNIGGVYAELGSYDKALEYYHKALATHEKLGEKSGVAIVTGEIGSLFAEQKNEGYDPAKAEEYLLKAIAMNEELGTKRYLYEFHKAIAELYEHEERWKESQQHFKKYHEIEKEVQSEEAKKQAEKQDTDRKLAIERAQAASEKKILNNILPEEITARLIKGENPIADTFDNVSILFMDIVDFTTLSTTITAQQLVHLLNAIFKASDGVMKEFGLEKIKTIGDAYMAVAGAPTRQEDHAHRAAQAALKLLEVMKNLVVVFPEEYGDKSWIETIPEIQVRIGVHCGPVAAGVVGENKFLYDLWGDAVNTASRMESHGEAGRVHVSEEFVEILTATVIPAEAGIHFEGRGEMDIKGKGMMKTYFLEKFEQL